MGEFYFQLILVGVFAVATVVGYLLIKNVPSLLHTPLMSGMNALSGITVLGAMTATTASFMASAFSSRILASIFGVLAIALAMVNVVGGFAVTDRMLGMIVKKEADKQKIIYTVIRLIAFAFLAVIACFGLMKNYAKFAYYALAVALSLGVLIGIALMSKVKLSKIGNRISAVCMLIAIILTLAYNGKYPVYSAWTVYIGLVLGGVGGIYLAKKVSMIQMPQMVALLNGLGGGASALVGIFAMFGLGSGFDVFSKITSSIALAVGMMTLLGSLVAAGKLHRILPQKPIVLRNHTLLQLGSLVVCLAGIVVFSVLGGADKLGIIIGMAVLVTLASSAFGIVFALRVGGADMPITISLLNSLSGVAGAIAGLAIGDLLLVAIGGIVGASGLLLTQIMCKAMNRKLSDILLGGKNKPSGLNKDGAENANLNVTEKEIPTITDKDIFTDTEKENTTVTEESQNLAESDNNVIETKENTTQTQGKQLLPTEIINQAKNVIIVPGYGMAIAQAQHLVKTLADKLIAKGTTVKYAIHPVAGRMPGHMNVLLCEADVDYEDLYEMDDINKEFATADATIVVGANDVLNPSAREAKDTPIYGMPVLSVDTCKNIFIFNYDLKPGYAGVENPLYTREQGVFLYLGNAADTLQKFIDELA